jgi:hypothetical protein
VSIAMKIEQVIEIARLPGLKSFVSDGDNFELDSLFNFKPMK